jgi:uncharacterized membrane protein
MADGAFGLDSPHLLGSAQRAIGQRRCLAVVMGASNVVSGGHFIAIRIGTAVPIGLLGAIAVGVTAGWQYALAAGWIAVTLIYLPMSAEEIESFVQQQHPTRGPSETFVILASIASLVGVAYLLMAPNVEGPDSVIAASVGFLSVIGSWLTVNTVFALRYALDYYTEPVGGIEFNEDEKPTFADFAYVAFTVAVTYGVTDTALRNRQTRITGLKHSLISFLFGAVILAITIQVFGSLTGPRVH